MNSCYKIALGVAGGLALVGPAQAQEAKQGNGGFWVGAVLGAEKADLGRKKEKPVYGVAAGYDFDLNGALVGVELEATDSSSGGCSNQVDDDGDTLCYKAGRDLYAGLRAGAYVASKLLLYVKGGYVNGAYRVDHKDSACCHIWNEREKFRDGGWRAGAGVQRDFGRAYVRAEYRYTDYSGSYSKHQPFITNRLFCHSVRLDNRREVTARCSLRPIAGGTDPAAGDHFSSCTMGSGYPNLDLHPSLP